MSVCILIFGAKYFGAYDANRTQLTMKSEWSVCDFSISPCQDKIIMIVRLLMMLLSSAIVWFVSGGGGVVVVMVSLL